MLDPVLFNLAVAAALIAALIYSVWLIHLKIDDASIIDLIWGAGFGIVAIVLLALNFDGSGWKLVLAALPTLWAVRYTTFIFHRNLGHGEDDRYTHLRKKVAKKNVSWPVFSFFMVYGFQALAMLTVCAPLIIGLATPQGGVLTWLAGLGVALWVTGFLFEAVGDLQLALFKKKHRDYDGPYEDKPVMNSGLWRYTRHPNYFGNACMWWGIGAIAVAIIGLPSGWAAAALIGPAFMNFALVFLTGKANNEAKMKKRPAYREYIKRTSGFFPLPPKDKREVDA